MIHDLVSEISSYFRHQDHSLGVRRLLDVCLDINKPELTRKAIDLSRRFHQYEKDIKTTGAPADLLEAANDCCTTLAQKILFPLRRKCW